jgi:hypothetical protein
VSLIVHRCQCGHPDISHKNPRRTDVPGACCHGACPEHTPRYVGEPEVLSTWDGLGKPVEAVVRPGTSWKGLGATAVPLCGCGVCVSLYESVVDVQLPEEPA